MWTSLKKHIIDVNIMSDKEDITSLYFSDNVYIGRDDGKIDCFSTQQLWSTQCFTSKFDYLESSEILEKVVAIQKLKTGTIYDYICACNERNLKILKVRNSESTANIINGVLSEDYEVEPVTEFNNAHSYIINSISANNDQRHLITSDYLKINLWDPEKLERYSNLVDVKPMKNKELVFVINSSKFSTVDNTIFGYTTTAGDLKLHDVRVSSTSQPINDFCMSDLGLEGVLKSVSDFTFIDSSLIALRNLNSVSIFDQRNPKNHLFSVKLFDDDYLNRNIANSDLVYERFKISSNSQYIFTGSYSNAVNVIRVIDGNREEVHFGSGDDDEFDRVKFVDCGDDFFVAVYSNGLYVYGDR